MITISAPGKIHLLGEHVVVYGKPALLATVDLRVYTTVMPTSSSVILSEAKDLKIKSVQSRDSSAKGLRMTEKEIQNCKMKSIIEPMIKKHLKLKNIPPYQINISSQIPLGVGLGSSAAISACYIAALLTFLKVKWDLNLINKLAFEAEKHFHGNPSGADNTTVVHGGLISFIKGKPIQPLPFSIPQKLAKNFLLINTGKPKEATKEMVELVRVKRQAERVKFEKIFNEQEKLTTKLLETIQNGDEEGLISIIKAGERNLEKIGVVSPYVKSIIRKIEKAGGAAKICGGGGKVGPTGILLCYHPNPKILINIAKELKLDYIKTTLGVEGLRQETT